MRRALCPPNAEARISRMNSERRKYVGKENIFRRSGEMPMNTAYERSETQKQAAGACFTIRNLTPCYPAAERELVKKDIEHKLYDIFRKYCEV